MKIAYADPPYPGQSAKHYKDHPDYAGEVDHEMLLLQLSGFDGFVLHTSSVALKNVLPLCPPEARVMAWVKPFCAFKRNVSVAYAWEPVIIKACRKPVVNHRTVNRDFISEPMTMKKGLTGAKPPRVIRWAFEMVGLELDDELHDLFPGTGIVTATWNEWRDELRFPL